MFIEDYGWSLRFFSSNEEWIHPLQSMLDYKLPSSSWGIDIFFMGQLTLHAYASTRIAASMLTNKLITTDLKVVHYYPEGYEKLPDFYDCGPIPPDYSILQILKLIKSQLKRAAELDSIYSL